MTKYAAEATQKVDEFQRISTAEVTQARRLHDHVRLAERHVDEVDSESQQYAVEGARLRELVLSLESGFAIQRGWWRP